MSNFKEEYSSLVTAVENTATEISPAIDIKTVKQQGLELEQRGKAALFRSILKDKPVAIAADFAEEII